MTAAWRWGTHSRPWLVGLVAVLGLHGNVISARTFSVGPGGEFKLPPEAAEVAQNGDVIEIAAGLYAADIAIWNHNNLTLRGIGGFAHLRADGQDAQWKGNWANKGNDTTIERIEFSGAGVPDGNGAGIRAECRNLTIRRCYFHENENGILGGTGDVLIERSELAHNGAGDGQTHNMYLSERVERFTLQHSLLHHSAMDARPARLVNNLFVGPGTLVMGPAVETSNVQSSEPHFVDRAGFDYRLMPGSPAVDAGTDPGEVDSVSILPDAEYRHPLSNAARRITGAPDAGAFELQ